MDFEFGTLPAFRCMWLLCIVRGHTKPVRESVEYKRELGSLFSVFNLLDKP